MKNLKKIGLIGCGEVGSLLLAQLNSLYSNTHFHVMESNPEISGKILDFQHATQFHNNHLFWNENADFSAITHLFYCAGIPNPPGADRSVMGAQNKAIVKSVFSQLKFNQSITIIVLSNPVEGTCKWIDEFTSGNHLILGTGTYLDSIRLRTLLPEPNAMVFGEHGPNMVIQSASLEKNRTDIHHVQKELISFATKIRQTEKGTKYGVVSCALEVLHLLETPQDIEIPLCVKLPENLKQKFTVSENIYLNLLVRFHPFIVRLPQLTVDEIQQFKKAIDSVKQLG